jgi:uncharacterized protein YlxP (DUF503 family)
LRTARRRPVPAAKEPQAVFIGILGIEFHLHGNESLKDKRRVANSLKRKVRNTFNVAIAEVDSENDRGRLCLAVVSVSNDRRHLESRMTKCLSMIEAVCPEELVHSELLIQGEELP